MAIQETIIFQSIEMFTEKSVTKSIENPWTKKAQQLLQEHHFQVSMSRQGNCYNNACIEPFHSLIKKECIYPSRLHTQKEAKQANFEYIDASTTAKEEVIPLLICIAVWIWNGLLR